MFDLSQIPVLCQRCGTYGEQVKRAETLLLYGGVPEVATGHRCQTCGGRGNLQRMVLKYRVARSGHFVTAHGLFERMVVLTHHALSDSPGLSVVAGHDERGGVACGTMPTAKLQNLAKVAFVEVGQWW